MPKCQADGHNSLIKVPSLQVTLAGWRKTFFFEQKEEGPNKEDRNSEGRIKRHSGPPEKTGILRVSVVPRQNRSFPSGQDQLLTTSDVSKFVKHQEFSSLMVTRKKGTATSDMIGHSAKKLHIHLRYNPAVTGLRIYSDELKTYVCAKAGTWMLIKAIFTIVKIWGQPRYLSVVKQINFTTIWQWNGIAITGKKK